MFSLQTKPEKGSTLSFVRALCWCSIMWTWEYKLQLQLWHRIAFAKWITTSPLPEARVVRSSLCCRQSAAAKSSFLGFGQSSNLNSTRGMITKSLSIQSAFCEKLLCSSFLIFYSVLHTFEVHFWTSCVINIVVVAVVVIINELLGFLSRLSFSSCTFCPAWQHDWNPPWEWRWSCITIYRHCGEALDCCFFSVPRFLSFLCYYNYFIYFFGFTTHIWCTFLGWTLVTFQCNWVT